MKQSCNKKEKNRTNIYLKKGKKTEKHFNNQKPFFTLKNRKQMKKQKINIFKNETKKGNTVKRSLDQIKCLQSYA